MGFNIAYNFQAIDDFSAVASRINDSMQSLGNVSTSLSQKMESLGSSIEGVGRSLTLRVTAPVAALSYTALKASSQVEFLTGRFESLSGSAEESANYIRELQKLAEGMPFKMPDIADAAFKLRALGVNATDSIADLKKFSDVSVALNLPLTSMVDLFMRAQEAPKMLGMMLKRTYPIILDELVKMHAEVTGKTEDIQKLLARGDVTVNVLMAAITRLTEKGGAAFEQTKKQQDTFLGRLGTFKTAIEQRVLEPLGDMIDKNFRVSESLGIMSNYLDKNKVRLEAFLARNKDIIKMAGGFFLVVAAVAPLLIALGTMVKLLGMALNPLNIIIMLVGTIAFKWLEAKLQTEGLNQTIEDMKAKIRPIINFLRENKEMLIGIGKVVGTLLVTFWGIGLAIKIWNVAAKAFKATMLILEGIGAALDVILGGIPLIFTLIILAAVVLITKFHAWKYVLLPIKRFFDSILTVIQAIEWVVGKVGKILGFGKSTKIDYNITSDMQKPSLFGTGKNLLLGGLASMGHRFASDINVTLNDPGGMVADVKAKTKGQGKVNLNVGRNMALARS